MFLIKNNKIIFIFIIVILINKIELLENNINENFNNGNDNGDNIIAYYKSLRKSFNSNEKNINDNDNNNNNGNNNGNNNVNIYYNEFENNKKNLINDNKKLIEKNNYFFMKNKYKIATNNKNDNRNNVDPDYNSKYPRSKKFICLLEHLKANLSKVWSYKNGSLNLDILIKQDLTPYLDLSYQNLTNENKLNKFVLRQINLKILSIAENNFTFIPYNSLLPINNSLNYLILRGNNLKNQEQISIDGENTALKFPELNNLLGIDLSKCQLYYLPQNLFENLTNLQTVMLSENYLVEIPSNMFTNNKNLKYLDLSHIRVPRLNNGRPPTTSLSSEESYEEYFIDMSQKGLNLSINFFQNLTELNFLDLSHTKITPYTSKSLLLLGIKLEYLSLCFTNIPLIKRELFANTSIKLLDLSGNYLITHKLQNNSFDAIQDTLEILWFAKSKVQTMNWIKNLKKLEKLNLSSNNIHFFCNQTLYNQENLEYLDLENNHITSWNYRLYENNKKLTYLNLKDNSLNVITNEMLYDFANINYLYLSKNFFMCNCALRYIIDIHKKNNIEKYKLDGNGNLISKYIHSHENRESNYDDDDEYDDDDDDNKNYFKIFRNIDKFSYNLAVNDLTQFKFILGDYRYDNYRCFNGTEFHIMENLEPCPIEKLETAFDLRKTLIIILTVIPISFMLTGLAIYFRTELKWFYLLGKNTLILNFFEKNKNVTEEVPKKIYKYDIFISYCDTDRPWVLEELLPNIENDELSICLHERDFKVGVTIWENIINNMDSSKNLLLIISNNFLKSNWCQFEMQIAQKRLFETRKNQLILIFLEEIPKNKRPRSLQYLMNIRTFIKWPKTDIGIITQEEKRKFWNRIKKSLNFSIDYS